MCGIVAAAAKREVSEILLEGLRRLEYRGYDSAGMALVDTGQSLQLHKYPGKVKALEDANQLNPITGYRGVAHTRWATHGEPNATNAHPHVASHRVALVHNGIIENHALLREELRSDGVVFSSETDTEVIVHLVDVALSRGASLFAAVQETVARLEGAYAIAVVDTDHDDEIVVAREGSPLVLGVGIGETFAGSDTLALRQVTDTFVYLEDGDLARLTPAGFEIFDVAGESIERATTRLTSADDQGDRGGFEHYMLKEIYEQPDRLRDTLGFAELSDELFGEAATTVFDQVQAVQIIACGTSYHAGLVARHWLEALAGIPCQVEVASEFRYRKSVALPGTLVVTISQSGETADTLAAIKHLGDDYALAKLAICNVDHSAIVRASDLVFLTQAGAEIGVASTKAFTTQLAALLVLTACLARRNPESELDESALRQAMAELPQAVEATIAKDKAIQAVATNFINRDHALFLGRGVYHPIAKEGALKLKEISYIHAEAYPAGELKHGPLALVDEKMPVVAVAPKDDLLEKLRSNLAEVRARGGQLFVFADQALAYEQGPGVTVIDVPSVSELAGPIVYTVVLQLLSYHVALAKGTDVDKPRNLAKSVTVE
ncbi:MAG: glutamine--fructose-6-phosphate transaminase (isomerizing) [Halieaceae bacterium MED-G27]|jgi:glucosamine--fructose-6-phosphate aminotransferase (isomerizing)|nr:glutamine--fructose-6-phosphate transaminase (isomerizing) [Halieaceae bacterium]MAV74778.1 glutamine--fructose-6-phosphate transaminase (isomerizing) [Halieaceae bacterium]OUT64400.1 MAG: glutamine--fructose-6-phosphate transaminase (isomerizing) [Cellvibrionales bacterium TMED21]OUT64961.1 MAG: glutamine--fructose-6-phosphate transaminase (isomerizing) [Cellvibrionales bacterium TMED21]PDH37571.1 MAG: glutamine--fructose-6-phosphate transaminase (isomerizing) [Halieaceae bacterium MED-G27]|tara:strand:- start:21 stop:1841 length:1821 start_codon:yes stop_codon:yes gene_type:complete